MPDGQKLEQDRRAIVFHSGSDLLPALMTGPDIGGGEILPAGRNQRFRVKFWQAVAVGGDELVAHFHDFVQGKSGGGEGIEHRGLVDVIAGAFEGGADEQFVLDHVRLDVADELRREVDDRCELRAVAIHQRGDLSDGVAREV